MRHHSVATLVLLAASFCLSCSDSDGTPPAPARQCNGHEALCERAFDEVAYPVTHNSMSNAEADWVLPNQNFGVTRQLNDGIRGLMLDTYEEDGELLLCHTVCLAGNQPLVEGLGEIKSFLDENPHEVVSIIFENYISHAETASAFEDSGLIDFVYTPADPQSWPTLNALVDAGTRLVVFQEKLPADDAFPWLMNIWDQAWETPFSFESPEDLVCDPSDRGDPDNALFLLNHFLSATLGGRPEFAEMVNYDPLFIDRALQCQREGSALPNFVAVDFYDVGDLFDVVDTLNGL